MKRLLALLFFLAAPSLLHAQGYNYADIVLGPTGQPVGAAQVTVCDEGSPGIPCTQLADIFTTANLTTPKANPTQTDGLGNYSFSAAPGRYRMTITRTGLTSRVIDLTLPCVVDGTDCAGGAVTLDQTFVTGDDETATLANSLQILAGANIAFDTSTPNKLVVSATASGLTRKVCIMRAGSDNGSALTNADIAPQTFQCKIPDGSTLIEIDVHADAGTPTVIVARNRNGSSADLTSATLGTAAMGGEACSNASGGLGINGTTTCSATIQNTGLLAGDYIYTRTATAGGVAALMTVSVVFTAPGGGGSSGVTSLTGTANQVAVDQATGDVTVSLPTNVTLPGTTTGTFSGSLTGDVTGDLTGDVSNATTLNLGVSMTPELVVTAGHVKVNGDIELDPATLIINGTTSGAVTVKVPAIATTFDATIPAMGAANHSQFLLLPNSVTPIVGQCVTFASVTPLRAGAVNCGGGGGGGGDVVGPATNTNGFVPVWNGTDSKILGNGYGVASANTVSTLVQRDGSGNFAAGTITATITGNVTGNLTGNVTGNVVGNVTGAVTGNASTATALASNPTDCSSNQFANAIAASGNLTCAALTLAGAQFANQGTTTTLLHGNAAGNPSWAAVNLATAEVTGNLPVTNLNSGTLADNTHFWRGDGSWAVPAGAGAGTVMSVASGDLPPLFTVSVTDPTNAAALVFTLTNAAGGTLFGRATGTTGAPAYTSTPALGIAGSTVGTLTFRNATSGDITLSPPTGALGTVTVTIPAATDTLVNLASAQTLSSKTMVAPILGTPTSVTLTNATGLPLATGVTGNLSVNNLNSGTGASSATFWRGDGTWSAGIAGLGDPGGNGIVARTALNTTVARTLTAGTGITVTNGTGVAGNPTIAEATVNTRRTCSLVIGTDNASTAIANSDLGPQGRQCYIPYAATVVEVMVAADAGTPNVIVARNVAGSISNLTSSALATAGAGGLACSNAAGTAGFDGATTCSATLQNTAIAAGSWLQLVSGTAGGTAKRMSIAITYTVN